MGQPQIEPHRAVAAQRDLGAGGDELLDAGLISGQVSQFGGASGRVEGGEVEGHWSAECGIESGSGAGAGGGEGAELVQGGRLVGEEERPQVLKQAAL